MSDATTTPNAFYNRDGDLFVPSGLGISPWNPRAQMGIAVAGLSAYALDAVPTRAPMLTARLTIDIMGAVPLEPLSSSVRVLREGPRIQLVSIELSQGATCWVRATALRVRVGESPLAEAALTRAYPDDAARAAAMQRPTLAAIIRVEGGYPNPGPGAWWVRPTASVVDGEPLRPLEALAMVSDYGSGVGPLVSPRDWTFANLDIALHLTRMPRGGWLLVDARSESDGNGVAVAQARLGDRDGMIGTSLQTVFLDRR